MLPGMLHEAAHCSADALLCFLRIVSIYQSRKRPGNLRGIGEITRQRLVSALRHFHARMGTIRGMADVLIEVLAAAGEISLAVANWFYPSEKRTAAKMAAGCLVLIVGMVFVSLFFVILLLGLAIEWLGPPMKYSLGTLLVVLLFAPPLLAAMLDARAPSGRRLRRSAVDSGHLGGYLRIY
jgi:hypothetical protein